MKKLTKSLEDSVVSSVAGRAAMPQDATNSSTTVSKKQQAGTGPIKKQVSQKGPNRTQVATEYLRNLAREAGAGAKLPTFNELMQQTGVSKATLSAALANLEAARVLQRKHGAGIFVLERMQHTTIAIIFEPLLFRSPGISLYWHLIWNALSDVARQRATTRNDLISFYVAPLEATPQAPLSEDLCEAVSAGRVDGILAVGLSAAAADFLTNAGVALVSHAGAGRYQVNVNSLETIRVGTEYLIQKGCNNLALWNAGDPETNPLGEMAGAIESVHHFLNLLRKNNRDISAELMFDGVLKTTFSRQPMLDTRQGQGYTIATTIFGDNTGIKPDGILMQNDMLAQGALTAMEQMGVRAGRDVHVVSQSNKGSTVLLGYEENIARVEYDPHDIAEQMFALLDDLMGANPPALDPTQGSLYSVLVKPRLLLPSS